MRKRTIKNMASTIFWYILYFLPVLVSIIYVFKTSGFFFSAEGDNFISIPYLIDILGDNSLHINEGIIYESLMALFSIADGVLPLMVGDIWASYLSWFVGMYLCHIAVDIILFVPKLAHKWMKGLTQQGGDE